MAALSLTMSAIAAQAANIQIPSLPYTITTPGTYVLTSSLSCPANFQIGISVNSQVAGPIVVDLKGFSLEAYSPGTDLAAVAVQSNFTNSNITIRNGTILGFITGVAVGYDPATGISAGYVSNVHLEHLTFGSSSLNPILIQRGANVHFNKVNSSSVSYCIFFAGVYGIQDNGTQSGNSYSNNSFDGY